LFLDRNCIEGAECAALAASLPTLPKLTSLNLSLNQLDDAAAVLLCDALAGHACLRTLDLWGNRFGDDSAIAFASLPRIPH
jgi:hypothetical protein